MDRIATIQGESQINRMYENSRRKLIAFGVVVFSLLFLMTVAHAILTHRAAAATAKHSFTLKESIPVAAQLAANPGKTPRTHMTNAMLLEQHQADVKRIAELEAEVARLKSK